MQTYTLRDVAGLLGLSRSVILRLVASGFVQPARGPRREYRFSFPDMVLLRTAQGLQAAQIPSRHIVRSLRRLRERLPEQMPLTGLRIAAVGNEVVVRDGGTPWQADSGQLLFDFEAPAQPAAPGTVSTLRRTATPEEDWFRRGVELETSDPAGAEAAYRRAIETAPGSADAYLNLGVLLGEAGRHAEAAALYRQGLRRCPGEALLHFNLGVALEDLQDFDGAIAAYEAGLAVDPAMADAHFNAARLHDQLGRTRPAIRHYSAYRRLRGPKGGA
jgi:tetratricopeptide (TPR) repeat protein